MQLVVLDGHTLNPGDLSWSALEMLAECTIYPRTRPEECAERIGEAELVLTNKVPMEAELIKSLPNLRYIGVLATGYNIIDLKAAKKAKVTVTNVPSYSTPSVAQCVFAHLLNWTHRVGLHADGVREGEWVQSEDFAYWKSPLVELAGKTLGLYGFGQIAEGVARIARSFEMEVIATTRSKKPGWREKGVSFVSAEDLFRRSDVLSLHCPLAEDTQHLVCDHSLSLMKPTAFLINTGRGPLIDEAALARALQEGRLAGAGLDVLSSEPPEADNPLLGLSNCHITPHYAWATLASRQRLMAIVADNVRAFLKGEPRNVVK